jgi:hypothetical protein
VFALESHSEIWSVQNFFGRSGIEEQDRKTFRTVCKAYYGEDGRAESDGLEWAAFAASCNLRDMGTPSAPCRAGNVVRRGSVSDARMRSRRNALCRCFAHAPNHERSLAVHGEPAGQIGARAMEIVRTKGTSRQARSSAMILHLLSNVTARRMTCLGLWDTFVYVVC